VCRKTLFFFVNLLTFYEEFTTNDNHHEFMFLHFVWTVRNRPKPTRDVFEQQFEHQR